MFQQYYSCVQTHCGMEIEYLGQSLGLTLGFSHGTLFPITQIGLYTGIYYTRCCLLNPENYHLFLK